MPCGAYPGFPGNGCCTRLRAGRSNCIFDEPCREGFLNPAMDGFENIRLYFVDQPGGQVAFSSSPWLGRWLGKPTSLLDTRFVQVHFRVDDVHFMIEDGGLAEKLGTPCRGSIWLERYLWPVNHTSSNSPVPS